MILRKLKNFIMESDKIKAVKLFHRRLQNLFCYTYLTAKEKYIRVRVLNKSFLIHKTTNKSLLILINFFCGINKTIQPIPTSCKKPRTR